MLARLPTTLVMIVAGVVARPARAAIADFRVNEVFPASPDAPDAQFVELHVPEGTGGNCLFPTTRLEIFDGGGAFLGAIAPFAGTVCYDPGSYLLFATSDVVVRYGVARDAKLDVVLPAAAGQVCLTSSQTRYDCARWGPIAPADAVRYLRNTDDDTAAPSIPPGAALARAGDTGRVASDFVLQAATPRQPNDGTVWVTPDAPVGPIPDAAPPPDARVIDAREFTRPDAAPIPRPDGNLSDPRFLSADPGGGATCGCVAGGRRGRSGALLALVPAAVLLWRARRRHRA